MNGQLHVAKMFQNQFLKMIGHKDMSPIYEYDNTIDQSNTTINQVQIEHNTIQARLELKM